MSYDIAARRLAWISVEWPGFVANGDQVGKAVFHSIEVQVDLLDKDDLQKVQRPDADTDPDGAAEWDKVGELARFKGIVMDWRGVSTGGVSAPFTDEHIDRMLKVPNFSQGFSDAYFKAWQGIGAVREKNSAASPASGQASDAA